MNWLSAELLGVWGTPEREDDDEEIEEEKVKN